MQPLDGEFDQWSGSEQVAFGVTDPAAGPGIGHPRLRAIADRAARAGEQPPVANGGVLLLVVAQEGDQLRMNRTAPEGSGPAAAYSDLDDQ